MQRFVLILFLSLRFLPLLAQTTGVGTTHFGIELKSIGLLQDKGYSFDSILQNPSLAFTEKKLLPQRATAYWLKMEVANKSAYAQSYFLTVYPNVDNRFFFFDEDAKTWISGRGGIAVPTDKERLKGRKRFVLQGASTTTIYILSSMGSPHPAVDQVTPRVVLENESVAAEKDRFFTTAWIVSIAILLILFLNSFHLYYRFRDTTVLYFLVIQLGAVLYLTAYRGFFRVIFSGTPFSLEIMPKGIVYSYGMNEVFMHLSVALIVFGLVQMTRHYLQTKITLPKSDAWLRYGMYAYLVFTVVVGTVNLVGFYLENYSLLYDNLLVLLVLSFSVATSITAYRRKLPSATAYLFAHVIPLCFLIAIAAYHVFVSFSNSGELLLPDLAVVSQALCFSAAIVSRIKILQDSLLAKEEVAYRLAVDITKAEFKHKELALEKEHILSTLREAELEQKIKHQETHRLNQDIAQQQSANKELNEKLEANKRELASTTLYVVQKNALLAELKTQIEQLNKQSPNGKAEELSGIKSILQSNLHLDDDWSRFKLHFEQVHPRFFEELQVKYPALTKNELRLYSYFHISLSTKEIATLLNIDPASVRRAKTRLYKKMAQADKSLPSGTQDNLPDQL